VLLDAQNARQVLMHMKHHALIAVKGHTLEKVPPHAFHAPPAIIAVPSNLPLPPLAAQALTLNKVLPRALTARPANSPWLAMKMNAIIAP